MENTIKDRLASYLTYKGINKSEFGRIIGVSSAYISSIRKSIQPDKTEKIASSFPDLNMAWLLTGEGSMLKNSAPQPTDAQEDAGCMLPLIPLDVLAGNPNLDNPGITADDCERYSVPEFSCRGADFLIRVSGDSMSPRYCNGNIIACKIVRNVTFIQWGKPYVIDTEQGILVKLLFPSKDPDRIVCRSVNSALYPDFEIPKAEIRSFSLVVGLIALE